MQVEKCARVWGNHKDNKATPAQLQWESEVVEYVDYIYKKIAIHGNAGTVAKAAARIIDKDIPFIGPHFVPPTYLHVQWRQAVPSLWPGTMYLKPLTVIHPVFYPSLQDIICPHCDSPNTTWDSWNGTGARSIYGLKVNERAIGYQLQCRNCKAANSDSGYCFATTNQVFWEKWEHWKLPRTCNFTEHFQRVSTY